METNTATPAKEPSMDQLRAMIQSTPEPKEPAAETEIPEPEAKKAKEETRKPESGTDKHQQQEEVEEELPEGVKKRIAKEVERTSRAQAAIDKAVSERKAKEAEVAKLTGKSGSEPVKTTEPAKKENREEPDLATFEGTLAEYKQAMKEFRAWEREQIENSVRETVSKELTERQAKEAQAKEWAAATEKHGLKPEEFDARMSSLAEKTPVGLQRAISELDDWSTVALHLEENEAEHAALIEEFKQRPARAIASLGKLEDRLTTAATKAAPEEKEREIPKPLKPIGGDATPGRKVVDLDKASFPEFKAEINRRLKQTA